MGCWTNLDAHAPPCGTTACIAGFATILSWRGKDYPRAFRKKVESLEADESRIPDYEEHATKVLGLTRLQAMKLFYASDWPHEFEHAILHAETAKEQAKVAIDRIELFIKTKGRQ